MSLEQRAVARTQSRAHPPMPQRIRVPGRRVITAQMARARCETAAMPRAEIGKGEIAVAIRRAAPFLGLSHTETATLLYLVSLTYPCDWEPDALLLVGPSNERLAHQLGISVTQIRATLRSLAERGLVDFHDSPTQSRRIRRARAGGPIVQGYGIDLSPLAHRYGALHQAWADGEEAFREAKALRGEIMSAWKALSADAACAAEAGQTSAEILAALEAAERVIADRGMSRDPGHLRPLAAKMHELADQVSACLDVIFSVDTASAVAAGREPILTTNLTDSAKATTERRVAPHAQEVSSSRSSVSLRVAQSNADIAEVGPIGGFPATPAFILQIAPPFRGWVTSAKPKPAEIVEAAHYVAGELGISRHAWETACGLLGRWTATVAVAVIANRHAAGLVRSPGGYLRGMLEQHRQGDLRLDRSLFGIADTLPGGRGKPS